MTRTDVTDQDRLRAPGSEEQLRRSEMVGREGETSTQIAAGGSAVEAIAGLAAVVLAIVGLVSSGSVVFYMYTIATIVVGVAVMLQGAAVGARLAGGFGETATGGAEFGGLSTQFLAGGAGVVLGILALLNIVPLTLVAISVIVFGSALLMGAGVAPQFSQVESTRAGAYSRDVTRAAAGSAGGAHVLIGLAAIVLGIVALVGVNPTILNLVALLVVGAGIALTGTALAGHMLSVMRR